MIPPASGVDLSSALGLVCRWNMSEKAATWCTPNSFLYVYKQWKGVQEAKPSHSAWVIGHSVLSDAFAHPHQHISKYTQPVYVNLVALVATSVSCVAGTWRSYGGAVGVITSIYSLHLLPHLHGIYSQLSLRTRHCTPMCYLLKVGTTCSCVFCCYAINTPRASSQPSCLLYTLMTKSLLPSDKYIVRLQTSTQTITVKRCSWLCKEIINSCLSWGAVIKPCQSVEYGLHYTTVQQFILFTVQLCACIVRY